MIRAPVRVRVAASKISCKQCGREYTTGDLAMLSLCESCGSELVKNGVTIETSQQIINGQRSIDRDQSPQIDVDHLTARISVKRYEIQPGSGNVHRDDSYPSLASRVLVASWVKVA